MVDYQSRFRMYGHGYTSPVQKYPVATHRELYHEVAPRVFKTRPTAHDCRMESMRDHTDTTDWETWVLAAGLSATYRSVDDMHFKETEERPTTASKKSPDKLIFTVGRRGKIDGDFTYPRGLCTNMDGELYVADTGNHRIQVFNNFGVFKKKFGTKGSGKGEFDEPTGVAELTNGDMAVADKNNKRVQVFTSDFEFKYEFATGSHPYSIDGDSNYNIVVGTTTRTVEVYRRGGKLLHKFSVGPKGRGRTGFQIALNDRDEVVISDPADGYVKFFTYAGKMLYKFNPMSNSEGLAVIPGGIVRTPLDQYLVSDSLNHTVSLYTERGILLQQVLCPTDDAGAIQACALGPEGHLIVCEFSVTGTHCVKIFRYRSCRCHASRPGSSKRRTPTSNV